MPPPHVPRTEGALGQEYLSRGSQISGQNGQEGTRHHSQRDACPCEVPEPGTQLLEEGFSLSFFSLRVREGYAGKETGGDQVGSGVQQECSAYSLRRYQQAS
jgi:hypothetical protein